MRPRRPDWRSWNIELPTMLIAATSVLLIGCVVGLLLRTLLGL